MNHRHILARSENYEVSHEFEVVFLSWVADKRPELVIGDFYGDPTAAIIDKAERFAIVVGCGMIFYNLKEPFEPYHYDRQTVQWKELLRDRANEWWIEDIAQISENLFRFTVDPNSKDVETYELILPDFSIRKLNRCV